MRSSTSFLEKEVKENERDEEKEEGEKVYGDEVREYLEESFMLPTMAWMMSMFALLDIAILFVVGST